MPCAGCGQARSQFVQSARHFDFRGMRSAVKTAVSINVDKLTGMSRTDIDRKYGGASSGTPTVKARPYRRTT
jgi:hypothetical protein